MGVLKMLGTGFSILGLLCFLPKDCSLTVEYLFLKDSFFFLCSAGAPQAESSRCFCSYKKKTFASAFSP